MSGDGVELLSGGEAGRGRHQEWLEKPLEVGGEVVGVSSGNNALIKNKMSNTADYVFLFFFFFSSEMRLPYSGQQPKPHHPLKAEVRPPLASELETLHIPLGVTDNI